MSTSTKDEIKGTFHEVKGEIKEEGQAKSRTILTWRLKAKPNTGPAKSKKKSGRSRKCSRSKLGGLCPEHDAAFGAN